MNHSCGTLVFRKVNGKIELLLVHPGGPYYEGTDLRSWSIPKGHVEAGESFEEVAKREFNEETGFNAPENLINLGTFQQSSYKKVTVFLGEGDYDASKAVSNTCVIPHPITGEAVTILEVDKAEWFDLETAKAKIHTGQLKVLQSESFLNALTK